MTTFEQALGRINEILVYTASTGSKAYAEELADLFDVHALTIVAKIRAAEELAKTVRYVCAFQLIATDTATEAAALLEKSWADYRKAGGGE